MPAIPPTACPEGGVCEYIGNECKKCHGKLSRQGSELETTYSGDFEG
jgi:hypothetical protein